MSRFIFFEPVMNIPISHTEMFVKKEAFQPEKLLHLFLEEAKRCYCTSMSFPSRVVSVREQQAQRQNYDLFVNIMAEMIKKYAPEITE